MILLTDNPSVPPPSVNDLIVRTQKVYKGPFQVGEDLLIIEVGDEVKAEKFHGAKENL